MAREIRHDIDGLKAIAIIAIVLYHFFDLLNLSHVTNVSLFNGGFLGVDVFFVVSGFLITAGIAYKLNTDSFALKDFYKRRFLRILPPLFPVFLFCLVVGYFFTCPSVYLELSKEIINTLVFTGNFRFANSGGYFSMDSSDKVLLHTWYLCITMQFYLIYPVILKLVSKFFGTAKVPFVLAALTLILMIASVFLSQEGNGYLLTQCRIWELFFGGVVFFASDFVKTKILDRLKGLSFTAEIAGLAVIIASIFMISLTNGCWYFTTSIYTVIGTSVLLLAHNSRTVLKNPLFSVIGKTSYSLYLWHWPILAIAVNWGFNVKVISNLSFVLILSALVFISNRYFEQKQFLFKVIGCSYAVILALCFLIKSTEGSNYLSDVVKDIYSNQIVPESTYNEEIYYQNNEDMVFKVDKTNSNEPPHIFFIGDSHIGVFRDFLRNSFKYPYYFYGRSATVSYGPVMSNLESVLYLGKKERQIYFETYKYMLSKLKDGDKVVISNQWSVQLKPYSKDLKLKISDELVKRYAKDLVNDFDSQMSLYPNLQFYILGQGIILQKSVVNCSKLDLEEVFFKELVDIEKCKISYDTDEHYRNIINETIKEYANSHSNVEFVDKNEPLYAGKNLFNVKIDGKPVFFDDNHLSYFGSSYVGDIIFNKIMNK